MQTPTLPTIPGMPSNTMMGVGGVTKELSKTYKNIGQYYDPSGIRRAADEGASFVESSGRQTAENAAREYSSRNMANGLDNSMAGLVRAQALLPALKATSDMKIGAEDKVAALKAKEGEATGTLAGQIAGVRNSYLSNLQGYMGRMQEALMRNKIAREQMAQNQNQFDSSMELDRDKFDFSKTQAGNDDLFKRLALMKSMPQSGSVRMPDWGASADPTNPMTKLVGYGDPFNSIGNMMSSFESYGN